MVLSNVFRPVALILVALVVAGCATTPPPQFPTEPTARRHYVAGERFLEAQRYEMAAAEFEQSLEFESGAYITHAKLAVAYFGQQRFADAARQFEATGRLWGGPSSEPWWAILQAVSLQRAGNNDEAERLLRHWTGPGVVGTALGFYTAGQPLPGDWKLLARYLLGDVDEDSVLAELPITLLSSAYVIFGISNAARGDTERAGEFLCLADSVLRNRSGYSVALVRAEMRNLEIGEVDYRGCVSFPDSETGEK